jgi:concanavalin A-like lectin/glucanase superfamily protein
MKYILRITFALMLSSASLLSGETFAQSNQYIPITANFTGKGALVMPPSPALDINGAGTIEFWVAPQWEGELTYDPAIIAYTGPKGPRFSVHMSANKRGIGVYAGTFYDGVNYDFSDGALHHVAIVTIADSLDIYIDGALQDSFGFGFADLPATDFSVGSIGNFSPFVGQIGQVRIWDEPIDPDTLINFALKPIVAEGPDAHPDIDALVGASTFGNPETSGFFFVGEPDDENLTNVEIPEFKDENLTPIP